MKKLLGMAICLVFLSSFCSKDVVAQTITKQFVQISNSDASQQIQNLILRSMSEWSAQGYTVLTYREFKANNPLPKEIVDRFQQNLLKYINREYGEESNSFVIYKNIGYGVEYELKVIEDCAGQCIPNKYTTADVYLYR